MLDTALYLYAHYRPIFALYFCSSVHVPQGFEQAVDLIYSHSYFVDYSK